MNVLKVIIHHPHNTFAKNVMRNVKYAVTLTLVVVLIATHHIIFNHYKLLKCVKELVLKDITRIILLKSVINAQRNVKLV